MNSVILPALLQSKVSRNTSKQRDMLSAATGIGYSAAVANLPCFLATAGHNCTPDEASEAGIDKGST